MVRTENLDFWITHGYNVLFVGAHGVGKTSIIKDAFNRHNLNWKYFSAATMDPWVDLVGVPKERFDENGEPYLDLLRCQGLDEVEAIFLDEFNRSVKKVRNAVMELIQFRTINGKPFKKLKVIWAAINPDDDETYDVERLDPAQADRFQIKVNIPYKPEKEYFTTKYGPEMSRAAIAWWTELADDIKALVSPRRLDYALEIYNKKGDVRFALPDQCNVPQLLTTLKHGPVQDALEKLFNDKDQAAAAEFMANENNYQAAIVYVKKTASMMNFFLPTLPVEKLAALASESAPLKYMLNNINEQKYSDCICNIYKTGTDKGAVREIKKASRISQDVAAAIGQKSMVSGIHPVGEKPESPYFSKKRNTEFFTRIKELAKLSGKYSQTTQERHNLYNEVLVILPSVLSPDEAIETLKFLDGITRRSHSNTVERLNHIMGIVNHCFNQIHTHTGKSLEKIVIDHGGSFGKLWKVIRSDRSMSAKLNPFSAKSQKGVA